MKDNSTSKQRAVFFLGGYDPSGSAGLIKDIASAKATNTIFYAIPTALTLQTFSYLDDVVWLNLDLILRHLATGLKEYVPSAVKFGIIKSFSWISYILEEIQKFLTHKIYVVIDPVVKSSTGFIFHPKEDSFHAIFMNEDFFDGVITPNMEEASFLGDADPITSARNLSQKFKVILKGGHEKGSIVIDRLFVKGKCEKEFSHQRIDIDKIRGKGCFYASALACYLSRGVSLPAAMEKASFLLQKFLTKQITT